MCCTPNVEQKYLRFITSERVPPCRHRELERFSCCRAVVVVDNKVDIVIQNGCAFPCCPCTSICGTSQGHLSATVRSWCEIDMNPRCACSYLCNGITACRLYFATRSKPSRCGFHVIALVVADWLYFQLALVDACNTFVFTHQATCICHNGIAECTADYFYRVAVNGKIATPRNFQKRS